MSIDYLREDLQMIVVPFYDVIIVPGVTIYFNRDYITSLTDRMIEKGDEMVFVMMKEDKKPTEDEMTPDDFYPIGIRAVVDGFHESNIGIKTLSRVNIEKIDLSGKEISVRATERPIVEDIDEEEQQARFEEVKNAYARYVSGQQWGLIVRSYVMQWKSIGEIAAAMSTRLALSNEEKYMIIEADSTRERFDLMEQALYEFLEISRVSDEAESAQEETNAKIYREDAIKKQISFLQSKLDEMHPENVSDVRRFECKIEECGMNETAKKEAEKVLNRMKQEGQHSSEYGLLYDYLDFVTSLNWQPDEQEDIDLKEAEAILDEDHFGLKRVKNRILQQIAVMTLNKKQSGSILLFVGAPGTGKTSIGQSIAKALHREYVRVSLGGVRDEAEIRGHRRTYIGAMPGRIMDGIKKSGSSNPVMVLDEVDKLSHDFHGDPASALLEVLDPEQNSTFTDHYMNVPYDLSNVLFVCTANTTDTIPEPLLNRMEVIQFPGYTASDKFEIARRHLLPRSMEAMGIKKSNLKVTDEAIRQIISDYTAESGVRGLKKRTDTLCRVAAVKLVRGDQKSITVSPKRLKEFLDANPIRHDRVTEMKKPGVVTGLAWTMAGGEILFIEAVAVKGSGKTVVTGHLGDVMKESVQIAMSLVREANPDKEDFFKEHDIHIHVPQGAVPKDGPSAGITMTTALQSLVTEKPVDATFAMTGEVSLRGNVMPIGGLPEKLMAAVRAGVKTVFIPEENVDDLEEVAEEVKEKLKIVPVHEIRDVMKAVGLPF